jgi:phenylalanyl-tRNA synthetase beta chain
MPVITFSFRDLVSLTGKELPADEMASIIPMMGADFHHYDAETDEMGIEFFPDRPDMYSVEGIARSLRTFLGVEKGLKHYPISDSGIIMNVEPSIEPVRPFVVAGVVRELTITDTMIRSLMEVQEKIHLTAGRKRMKVSIGIHDLCKVEPPFTYTAVKPEDVSFVPLGKTEPMNLNEILQRHEKGIDYAYILEGKERYPIIFDKNGEVLSFPPIINGILTTVTEETKDVFIDVTGTDLNAISGVLNIVATLLAERGGRIQTVKLTGSVHSTTPDLKPIRMELDPEYCNSILGLKLADAEMASCLEKMGHDVKLNKHKLEVQSPATRMDLLHPIDLVEDVAKGYGYAKFGKAKPRVQAIGAERPIERASDLVRHLMIGYDYYEVTTLTLSSQKEQFDLMRLPSEEVVEILNPISEDHTCLRVHLLPSLLAVLRKSKHRDLPQRIFEVGDVLKGPNRRKHLAAVAVHPKASFTEMKSLVDGVMRDLVVSYTIASSSNPMFIDGRGADLLSDGQPFGHFGEMHPEVIINNELGYPVIGFEIDLETALKGRMQRLV